MKLAGELIEDVTERLAYVSKTEEEATQKSLDLTEEALSTLDNLKVILQMKSRLGGAEVDNKLEDDVLMQVAQAIESVQQKLTELLMTQSFQDLTGQVLQRVMTELQQVDPNTALCGLVCEQPDTAGFGPAATQKDKGSRAQEQTDVDDLLASMGL